LSVATAAPRLPPPVPVKNGNRVSQGRETTSSSVPRMSGSQTEADPLSSESDIGRSDLSARKLKQSPGLVVSSPNHRRPRHHAIRDSRRPPGRSQADESRRLYITGMPSERGPFAGVD